MRIWEAASGRSVRVLRGHTAGVAAVSFGPAEGVLVSSGRDKTLRLWEVGTRTLTAALEGHTEAVNVVAAIRGGGVIAHWVQACNTMERSE